MAVALVASCLLALLLASGSSQASHGGRPNIIFLTTDDQTVADMQALPRTASLIGGNGVSFANSYSSYPLCCPARATWLSGQYAHNHNVLGNTAPDGGYAMLNDKQTLPVWLQAANYRTVHIGKMPNGYGSPDQAYVPPGWGKLPDLTKGEFYGFLPDPPSAYYGFKMNENGVVVQHPSSDYQTDVYADYAVKAIDDHVNTPAFATKPLYLEVHFFAPHDPADPATRHLGAYGLAELPKDASYNEKNVEDKPKWLRAVRRLGGGLRSKILARHRKRLESLLSVDEAINEIVSKLAVEGLLGETYIVFTSDNGYMQGQHRLHQGKFVAYEPSAEVPLMIRGPGIPTGAISNELVTNVDLVKTFLDFSGAAPQITIDGRSLLPYAIDSTLRSNRPLLLETGRPIALADPASASAAGAGSKKRKSSKRVKNLDLDNTAQLARTVKPPKYRALRTKRYLLIKYADGGRELYDMRKDPLQLESLYREPEYKDIVKWMLKRIKKFTRCAGDACNRELKKPPKPLKIKEEKKGKK